MTKTIKTPGPGKGGARKNAGRKRFNLTGPKRTKTGYTFAPDDAVMLSAMTPQQRAEALDTACQCIRNTTGLLADQKAVVVALNSIEWAIKQLGPPKAASDAIFFLLDDLDKCRRRINDILFEDILSNDNAGIEP